MVKSLLQRSKACYICGTTLGLHLHHIFYGTANRTISDADGCVVYLCQDHHTGARGVHFNKKARFKLKNEVRTSLFKALQQNYRRFYTTIRQELFITINLMLLSFLLYNLHPQTSIRIQKQIDKLEEEMSKKKKKK